MTTLLLSVMAGLVPAIYDFLALGEQAVDGRDEPGHDGLDVVAECATSRTWVPAFAGMSGGGSVSL